MCTHVYTYIYICIYLHECMYLWTYAFGVWKWIYFWMYAFGCVFHCLRNSHRRILKAVYIYSENCILHTHVQHVPTNMRLEIITGMEINILDFQSSGLFSNEPFEKRPVMTFEDFDVHFDDHFESHSFGSGLYIYMCIYIYIYIYMYICTCMYSWMYAVSVVCWCLCRCFRVHWRFLKSVYTYPQNCIYAFIYLHIHIHIKINVYRWICICVCTYIYVYICIYIHECIRGCMAVGGACRCLFRCLRAHRGVW